jgi:hypothetical protein
LGSRRELRPVGLARCMVQLLRPHRQGEMPTLNTYQKAIQVYSIRRDLDDQNSSNHDKYRQHEITSAQDSLGIHSSLLLGLRRLSSSGRTAVNYIIQVSTSARWHPQRKRLLPIGRSIRHPFTCSPQVLGTSRTAQ